MIVAKTPIRRSANLRLSGMGSLTADYKMVIGGTYDFYFTFGSPLAVDPNDVTKWVATDSNFRNPVASVQSAGFLSGNKMKVSFQYAGRGSRVDQAGAEMQNVINSRLYLASLYFDSAEETGTPTSGGGESATSVNFDPTALLASALRASGLANRSNVSQQPSTAIPWTTIGFVGGGLLLGTIAVFRLTR